MYAKTKVLLSLLSFGNLHIMTCAIGTSSETSSLFLGGGSTSSQPSIMFSKAIGDLETFAEDHDPPREESQKSGFIFHIIPQGKAWRVLVSKAVKFQKFMDSTAA